MKPNNKFKNKIHSKNSSLDDNVLSNIFKEAEKFNCVKVSIKITIIYVIIGVIWIVLTDNMANYFATNKNILILANIIKGFIYVAINSIVLFFLIYYALKRIQLSEKKLIKSYKKLEKAHEKLIYSATYDFLTNLPNRFKLREDFYKNSISALLVIDIDNLKHINDVFGNSFGDKVIVEVSNRLKLLKNDYPVYRYGDDEFILLIKSDNSFKEVECIAKEIIENIKKTMDINGNEINITVSVGSSLYTKEIKDSDELIKEAYTALRSAKKKGKNKFVLCDSCINDKLNKRMKIEKNIITALNNNEFYINYQPQYNVLDGKIAGFEALLRWKNKDIGFVSPEDFIGVAEDTNLIVPIGKWVLENACKFIKNINEEFNRNYTICVNISILQIMQNDFVDMVSKILKDVNLDNELLELEITESIMMESYKNISCKIKNLRSKKIKIALDDFGKGYSSFSHLKQLPITTLKIDKSFIDNIVFDTKCNYIVGAIISIGKNLGIDVVAEGVETKEQYNCLVKHGCDKIQGYYFSKPVQETDVIKMVM